MKRITLIAATLLTLGGASVATAAASSASVCQPNGAGCTQAGTYSGPNAVINSNFLGFKVVWTKSVVQPYSSGVPLYWTAYVTYTNISSSTLTLECPGGWPEASYVSEHMSGGSGDDGTVDAESTMCSAEPSLVDPVPPGGTFTAFATFHNVPWPGSAVSITWGDGGTSPYAYPFGAPQPTAPPTATGVPAGNHSWNGYTTNFTSNTKVKSVSASWNVPSLNCGNGTNASQWVGLGGVNSPLVQVGTTSVCNLGVEVTLAVYEVVPKTGSSTAKYIVGLVTTGDSIDASVSYNGGNRYTVHFRDNAWDWSTSINVTQPGYTATPAEADWIIEASKAPLAQFSTAEFTDAIYNGNTLLTRGIKYEAGVSGGLQTSVGPIGQYGGAGPHFSLTWLRG